MEDGLEAIETANSQKIDLILLDIQLPYFSGFWFFNAFRQKSQTKNVPVVVVSAMSKDEDVQKAYRMGASAYLKKPFRQNDLLEVVQKALN
jgi:CheY-like chemotaxis protein